jgi:hypothetical protein
MATRKSALGIGYEECGLCSGMGHQAFQNDEVLFGLYAAIKNNPDRIRRFLESSPHATCSGLQIYLATGDRQIGEIFAQVYKGSKEKLPYCSQRMHLKGLKGVSFGTLSVLVQESLNTNLEVREEHSALGVATPEFDDYKQQVLWNTFRDGNECNPDELRVVDQIPSIAEMERRELELQREKPQIADI